MDLPYASSHALRWEEILLGAPTRIYPRDSDVQWSYHCHKILKTNQFGSIENYLQIATTDPFEDVVFLKNRFPYVCAPGIRHYVAWITGRGKDFTADQIITLGMARFPGCEIFAWENRPDNRSIHTLRHYQVFIRMS